MEIQIGPFGEQKLGSRKKMRSSWSIVSVSVLGFLCFLCLVSKGSTAVISIDFSSEWIKVALVKPGVPMEIVLNKESKRKTAAIVALRNEERLFSDAAATVAVKYPKQAYQYLQFLAGLQYDNPLVKKYREWFPYYDIRKDGNRNTILFQHSEDLSFTPEELIAMLLNNSRELAQDYAGTPIRNAVIIVPQFYNQAQRRAVINAAGLVGLNVLQLITDTAAVALNYGVFRRNSFNSTATYMMFFDMGSTSTLVSVVEYKKVQVKEGSTMHIEPQLAVKGIGFDRTLGGLEMDMRLRNHLAKIFSAKHKTKTSVYESPRAMAKLLKEARRLKMVLSANNDHMTQIEGLHEDIDFSTKVSRADFEDMCADLFDRIEEPVKQALRISEVTLDEIESIILVGGGTRVPKVQEKLLQIVKRSELGKNLNTDEAAAMGAVYQAASMSKLFRVKKFIVKEANTYPIQVSFEKPTVDSDGNPITKTITRTLFNVGNPYPQRKVLTFNRYSDDFSFSVFYGKMDYLSEEHLHFIGSLNLTSIRLNGIAKALADNKEGEPGGIKAHFRMDENGTLLLESVQAHFEHEVKEEASTFSKITSAFSNLFGGSEDENSDKATEKEGKVQGEDNSEDKEGDSKQKEEGEGKPNQEEETSSPADKETEKKEESEEETQPQGEEEEEKDMGEREDSEPAEESKVEEEQENEEEGDVVEEEEEEETEEDDDEEELPEDETSETETSDKEDGEGVDKTERKEEDEQEKRDRDEGTTDEEESTTTTTSTDSSADGGAKETPISGDGGNKSNETVTVKKQKKAEGPKTQTVKVNITAEIEQLDLTSPSSKEVESSATKLRWLQQRDEDRRENEKAKNSLESHIFEFTDFMTTEDAVLFSTEEERKGIQDRLREAGEWLEEDGYHAETEVYYQKLRELRRGEKPLIRRMDEANKRPKLLTNMYATINMSLEFLVRMKNLSDLDIFTAVEEKTLADVSKETMEWLLDAETKLNATLPHEDPLVLASEIEDKTKKLEREIYYLVNKVKNYKPKKPKVSNATNTTSTNTTNTTEDKEETVLDNKEGSESQTETGGDKEKEEPAKEEEDDDQSQIDGNETVKKEEEEKTKEEEEEEILALPNSQEEHSEL